MKRYVVIMLVILTLSVVTVATANRWRAVSNGTAGINTSNVVLLPEKNETMVVINMSYTAATSTIDLDIVQGSGVHTTLSADEAASQTAISLSSCTGIADDAWLVFADPSGDPIEATVASACNDTTNVATVTAITNAFKKGSTIYDTIAAAEIFANVGSSTTPTTHGTGHPVFVSKLGEPILFVAGTAASELTFQYLVGESVPR